MNSSGHLDWLSVTYPAGTMLSAVLPREIGPVIFQRKGDGKYGYRDVYVSKIGVSAMVNGAEIQGVHVQYHGDDLELIREQGVTDRNLCVHALEQGGKVGRIDLALNLHGCSLTVGDVVDAHETGALKTPAKRGLRHKTYLAPGDDYEVGSRTSDRFMRVYDRNAKLGRVDEESWVRLELECKKMTARGITSHLAAADNTRQFINAAIGDYITWNENQELTAALADNNADLPVIPRKITGTYRWLLEQVAPAMARYQVDHPDEDIEAAFLVAYQLHLDRFQESAPNYDSD